MRKGKLTCAQTSPPSISALACKTVTPHSASPSSMAQSSAEGPRSPTIPGCTTKHTCCCQIEAGIARFKKGATIRSGLNKATASSLTESAISSSTDTKCPHPRNATKSRCVRLLKLCAKKRMRMISRYVATARPTANRPRVALRNGSAFARNHAGHP